MEEVVPIPGESLVHLSAMEFVAPGDSSIVEPFGVVAVVPTALSIPQSDSKPVAIVWIMFGPLSGHHLNPS